MNREEIYRIHWSQRRPEHAEAGPIPVRTLLDAGGRVVGRAGLGGRRALVEMPDGRLFEEGLDCDGGCYLRRS